MRDGESDARIIVIVVAALIVGFAAGISAGFALSREAVCIESFSHATTPSDSLAVLYKYDYCKVEAP